MSKATAFWDASALVPLCVEEIASGQAQSYLKKQAPVVWWASQVEVHSAISRLHRMGKLDDLEKQGALARLTLLSGGWKEILPDDQLRELAGRVLDRYSLRAADSMQLAAALTWCQQRPSHRPFICADQRLSEAAESAGFAAVLLSRSLP